MSAADAAIPLGPWECPLPWSRIAGRRTQRDNLDSPTPYEPPVSPWQEISGQSYFFNETTTEFGDLYRLGRGGVSWSPTDPDLPEDYPTEDCRLIEVRMAICTIPTPLEEVYEESEWGPNLVGYKPSQELLDFWALPDPYRLIDTPRLSAYATGGVFPYIQPVPTAAPTAPVYAPITVQERGPVVSTQFSTYGSATSALLYGREYTGYDATTGIWTSVGSDKYWFIADSIQTTLEWEADGFTPKQGKMHPFAPVYPIWYGFWGFMVSSSPATPNLVWPEVRTIRAKLLGDYEKTYKIYWRPMPTARFVSNSEYDEVTETYRPTATSNPQFFLGPCLDAADFSEAAIVGAGWTELGSATTDDEGNFEGTLTIATMPAVGQAVVMWSGIDDGAWGYWDYVAIYPGPTHMPCPCRAPEGIIPGETY